MHWTALRWRLLFNTRVAGSRKEPVREVTGAGCGHCDDLLRDCLVLKHLPGEAPPSDGEASESEPPWTGASGALGSEYFHRTKRESKDRHMRLGRRVS